MSRVETMVSILMSAHHVIAVACDMCVGKPPSVHWCNRFMDISVILSVPALLWVSFCSTLSSTTFQVRYFNS